MLPSSSHETNNFNMKLIFSHSAYDSAMDSPYTTSIKQHPAGTAVTMHWAFEQSPDCIQIIGCTGALMGMTINGQCALEIDDFSAVLGVHWTRLWPEDVHADVHAAIDAGRAGTPACFTAFGPTAKGTPRWWNVLVTPIHDGAGVVRSLLAVARDITSEHHALQDRVQLAARLEATMRAAGFGEWHMDLVTGMATCGVRHGQCFGYAGAVPDWSVTRMLAHVHPGDQARVAAALADARNGTEVHFECRVVWPDTSVHWIGVQGSRYTSVGRNDHLIGLVSDITGRMHKAEVLQEVSRKKDEFLAMLAHELRNPLAPICAAAQVINGGRADVAQQAKAGAIIQRQARHMTHLLDDLLDVARVTQGLVTLDMAQVDLVDVVSHALEQARPLIERYRHRLDVTLPPASVLV